MLLTLWICLVAPASAVDLPAVDAPNPGKVRPARKDAALIVGNEDYAALPDAAEAGRDAEAFGTWLTTFVGVPTDHVVRLSNVSATDIAAGLTRASTLVGKGGTLWVYYAGHGAGGARGQRLLVGADASADPGELAGVSVEWVTSTAGASPAARVLVVLDAGFGGLGRAGEELFPGQRFTVTEGAATADPRVSLWVGTSGAEPAGLLGEAHHGLFTWCVLGALRGWADGHGGTPMDHTVQLAEAQTYVARMVRILGGTAQRPGRDPRAELAEWSLARAVEAAPDDHVIDVLADLTRGERIRVAQAKLYARATEEWAPISAALLAAPPVVGSPVEGQLRLFLAHYDSATVQVDGQDYAVIVPQVALARTQLDAMSRAAPTKKKSSRKRGSKAAPAPVVNPATALCMDLVALQVPASEGKLSTDEAECLEARIAAEPSQTLRDKLSRVLLVNADARGDDPEWERLADRHLETIDQSDPDLCLKYAVLLSRGEIEDANDVIHWAEVALDNKARWVGPVYTSRVYTLYRLRAESATRLWADAEARRLQDPSSSDPDELALLRGRARDDAREWLDYARSSRQAEERALALCQSAAGTAAFCSP